MIRTKNRFILILLAILLIGAYLYFRTADTVLAAYHKGDYRTVIQKAEQGDAVAENILGVMYQNGKGVPQDFVQAFAWYEKAAKQDHRIAQNSLGALYMEGKGVEQNTVQAFHWFRKSAKQGYAQAQHNLGYIYEKGVGVEKNITEAKKWYRKAAEQGHEESKAILVEMNFQQG